MKLTAEMMGFAGLAGVALISALGVLTMRSPVRSALLLVVNFLTLAALYFTLNAQLLGVVQVIVYVGAILVLFLFVIMLLNLTSPQGMTEKGRLKLPLAIVLGAAFVGLIASQLAFLPGGSPPAAIPGVGTAEAVGKELFTRWVYPFEITSIVLLVGLVGTVLLAKRRL
jgi:NADH-quinone oxidoreductase subunit J